MQTKLYLNHLFLTWRFDRIIKRAFVFAAARALDEFLFCLFDVFGRFEQIDRTQRHGFGGVHHAFVPD